MSEATGGFEPPIAVLQTTALPLGYVAGNGAILPDGNLSGMALGWLGVYSSPPCQTARLATA